MNKTTKRYTVCCHTQKLLVLLCLGHKVLFSRSLPAHVRTVTNSIRFLWGFEPEQYAMEKVHQKKMSDELRYHVTCQMAFRYNLIRNLLY